MMQILDHKNERSSIRDTRIQTTSITKAHKQRSGCKIHELADSKLFNEGDAKVVAT